MEGDHQNEKNVTTGGSSGTGASPASSRWNPTKEQISMLEGLYRQGIRTPSAEQIKQITSRLRAFGHIEGKNVFYWFQNHKARQRQKQKQENMAYMNRFLHRTSQPIFPPSHHYPCPNVVCGPYYLPVGTQTDHHAGTTLHHQFHPNKLPPSNGIQRRSPNRFAKLDKVGVAISCGAGTGYEPAAYQEGYYCNHNYNNINSCNQETLPLFPLSPTGVLKAGQQENTRGSSANFDVDNPTGSESAPSFSEVEGGHDQQPFYDFFSGS